MNYDQFRATWHEAMGEVGMLIHAFPPVETVDLANLERGYEVRVRLGHAKETEPFHVSALLSWRWDALQAARTATTEEDALRTFLGTDRGGEGTERPWLRVDLTLSATLPWGAPLPLPPQARWRRWVADVAERLELLLVTEWRNDEVRVLSYRGKPEAEVEPADDGRLRLTGVQLQAWKGIDLPRAWDDPGREKDEDPFEQLADFLERVWEAMDEWNGSLEVLVG